MILTERQPYIKTADFTKKYNQLVRDVKSLRLEDEKRVLWILDRFSDSLMSIMPDNIEVPECVRWETR